MDVDIIIADIGDCNETTCQNGGTCVDGVDGFTCVCRAGWTGVTCEIGG